MKFIFISLVLTSTINAQSADFRFYSDVCQKYDGHAKSVVNASSFWLSESPAIDPMSSNRILIQSGFSSPIKKIQGDYWTYPNLDFGIKVTNNLAITGKLFGFSAEKESPQVLGAGIQYYYGGKDTLNWVTSIQRVDLKGLSHFRLTSLTFDIRKWLVWNSIQFRVGGGANFYKERSYYNDMSIPSKLEGQVNYLGIDALKNYSVFKIGFGTRLHSNNSMVSFFIQKEIF
ncbi:MAG TPA: hypothetical protein EYM60_07205 [Candidatus Marinimicrobia bacterium]|nr:hypothetical protein [Candidatus Neomarinimicrobiota bacterium]